MGAISHQMSAIAYVRALRAIALGGACVFYTNCATAQITPDNTLGTRVNGSLTAPCGGTCTISNGSQRGSNLFHSFKQFSLPNVRDIADFRTLPEIQNVLVRVTSVGSPFISNINGTIQTSTRANFFFLNPNGIIFGPGATLNIGGAFLATTANRLQFKDGTQFTTTDPAPLLTITAPIGLGLTAGAGNITMQSSSLSAGVTDNFSDLALVGGNVSLDNTTLRTPGGRVELAGLAAPGTIGLNVVGDSLSLNVPNEVQRSDVSLLNQAIVDVSGAGGGDIAINARDLDVLQGSRIQGGIAQRLGLVNGKAGNIVVNAQGAVNLKDDSIILNAVPPETIGQGGDITITSESLTVTNGAKLVASTFGHGNAGNVTINARGPILFTGVNSDGSINGAFSTVESGAVGNGGNINITAQSLSVTNGAQLQTATAGKGNAGSVTILAHDAVSFDGMSNNGRLFSGAFSTVEKGAMGQGGDIKITTGSLSVTNGSGLIASTRAQGDAGSITILARDSISFDDRSQAFTTVEKGGVGQGGDVKITTGSLSVTNGAQLAASTSGKGNAGSVTILARDAVSFDGSSEAFSTVENGAMGQGGDIKITTGSLSVTNGAQLAAATRGWGDAGSVNITARNVISLDRSSAVLSSVEEGGVGQGGKIEIMTGSLSLTNGAQLIAVTSGQGNAGSVKINAHDDVSFVGVGSNGRSSGVFTRVGTSAVGQGGDINITARSLLVTNGAVLSALTHGNGDGGDITINANTLEFVNGGQVLTTTSGNGSAGKITVNAADRVFIHGNDATFNNRLAKFPDSVTNLGAASGFFVRANSSGSAGDIKVTSPRVTLDNQGMFIAESSFNNGGNITLQVRDLLLLRHDSQISTTAGTASAGGNGGNITINAPNGFVVATKNENNDITANAFFGSGGVIKINALGIYNFNQPSLDDLEKLLGTSDPNKLNPQQLATNDITAISLTSPTLSGQVNLITPDIDPAHGLVTLPTVTENTPKPISSSCAAFNELAGGSNFTITGRGGLPPSPDQPLTSDVVWSDTRLPTTTQHQRKTHAAKPKPQPIEIVPATGWIFNGKGEVTLISSVSNATTVNTPTNCPAR